MELGLAGRCALVTGGSRGIGRAIVEALVAEGVSVAFCARGRAGLEEVAGPLRAAGGRVLAIEADLSTEEGAALAVGQTIAGLGRIDLLVNNAGGSLRTGPFQRATAQEWRQVLDLNLMSAVWCNQRAVAWMRANGGGAIVNVSSIVAREYGTSAPYTASKAAMVAMTKEMAIDLAKDGIRVNSVAPGSILFPGGSWAKRHEEKPEMIAKMLENDLPWGRFGKPEEVAAPVLFLLSPRASWITGSTLVIDGGQSRAF